jgi:hypothetical protein
MSYERLISPIPAAGEYHHLPTDSLRAEWAWLIVRLSRLAQIRFATDDVHAGGRAQLRLQCEDARLNEVDRLVMGCLVIDPYYRQALGAEHVIVGVFRSWWRGSVPFLLDPDGARHHYRYEVLESENVPTAEE